jgi:hypothetical protein
MVLSGPRIDAPEIARSIHFGHEDLQRLRDRLVRRLARPSRSGRDLTAQRAGKAVRRG